MRSGAGRTTKTNNHACAIEQSGRSAKRRDRWFCPPWPAGSRRPPLGLRSRLYFAFPACRPTTADARRRYQAPETWSGSTLLHCGIKDTEPTCPYWYYLLTPVRIPKIIESKSRKQLSFRALRTYLCCPERLVCWRTGQTQAGLRVEALRIRWAVPNVRI